MFRVLETLIIKITGNAASYHRMVAGVVSSVSGLQKRLDQFGSRVDKTFIDAINVVEHFGNSVKRITQQKVQQGKQSFLNAALNISAGTIKRIKEAIFNVSSLMMRLGGAGGPAVNLGAMMPFNQLWQDFQTAAGMMFRNIIPAIRGYYNRIKASVIQSGVNLKNAVITSFTQAFAAVRTKAFWTGLFTQAKTGLQQLPGLGIRIGRSLVGGISRGIAAAKSKINIGGLLSGLVGGAKGVLGGAGGFLGGALGGTKAAFTGTLGAVSTFTTRFISSFSSMGVAAQKFFKRMQQGLRRLGYDMSYLGRRVSLYITAPIVAMAGASVKAFARFDDAMTTSLALLGDVSDRTRRAMEEAVFDISSASRTGPTDAALGYFHLASAGFEAAESMKVLGTVEKFAVAGAFDINESGHAAGSSLFAMGRATEYLVGVQAALGLRTADINENLVSMTRISDVLTQANQLAQAKVEDFSKALTNKGAAALRMINKDLEEGTAILAAYAAQNVKGEEAGNKLYIVLRDLQRANIKNSQIFRRFGIDVFDATGTMRPFADILEQMENKLGTMSDRSKRAALMMMGFQDRSVAATIQLFGMSDAIRRYEKALRSADGMTEKVAERRLKSFTSQMMMLRNQIHVAAIRLGQEYVPALMKLNEMIKAGIKWWDNLTSIQRKWIAYLALAVAAVGPLLLSFGTMTLMLTTLSKIFGFVKVAILGIVGVMTSPWMLVIAGIAAVVALLVGPTGLAKAWYGVGERLKSFVTNSVGFMENFKNNMVILVDWIRNNWKNVFVDAWNAIKTFFSNMVHNSGVAVRTLQLAFATLFGYLKANWDDLVVQWSGIIAGWMTKSLGQFRNFAKQIAKMMFSAWKGVFSEPSEADLAFAFELANDVIAAMRKGMKSTDIGADLREIMEKGLSEMKGPLEDFARTTTPLEFIFDVKEEFKEIAEPIEGVRHAHEKMRAEMEEPIRLPSSTEGIKFGSAAHIAALRDAEIAFGGEKEAAAATRRATMIARRAERREFLRESFVAEPKLPVPAEVAEVEAFMEGAKPADAEFDELIQAVHSLVDEIKLGNDLEKDRPVVEIDFASLE